MSAVANGMPLSECRVCVTWSGPMVIDMVAASQVVPVGGLITLIYLDMTIVCTLVDHRFGNFAGQWFGRAVSGQGGWKKTIPAKGYRSPAGLVSTQIFTDSALSCGELPPVVAVPQILGGFYVREEGPASNVFQLLRSDLNWWVPPSGITQVGIRTNPIPAIAPIEVIDAQPQRGRLVVATDSPGAYQPGTSFLDQTTQTIQTVDLVSWIYTADGFRGEIWTV